MLKARLIYKYLPAGKALRNNLSDILHQDHRPVHMHRQIWHVHELDSRDVLCLPVLYQCTYKVVTIRLLITDYLIFVLQYIAYLLVKIHVDGLDGLRHLSATD